MPRMKNTRTLGFWPPLLESQILALSTLANEGPTNIYQIAKKANKAYSLMFNAIKELEKRSLVMLVEKKQTSKGTTANIYDLTFTGILSTLQRELAPANAEQWSYDQIRKIINKYNDWLPLVFGKWGFFQKVGVEKIALLRLKAIVDRLNLERTPLTDLIGYGGPLVPHADIKTVVCWLFYFIGLFPINAEFGVEDWQIRHDTEAWIDAWKQDKDIVAYFMEELEDFQRRLKNLGAMVESHITRIIGTRNMRKVEGGE